MPPKISYDDLFPGEKHGYDNFNTAAKDKQIKKIRASIQRLKDKKRISKETVKPGDSITDQNADQ